MYEDKTFNSVLNEMLSAVPDDIDKREGSIIYNALAPAALVLRQMYLDMDQILKETFADTASREFLIKRAYERGIVPFPATNAVMKGEFNLDIGIGKRFSIEGLNFVSTEKISDFVFKMECETSGSIGHSITGRLIPIDYISGLTSAELTEVILPGEDEEETESLRSRYLDSLETEAFGGNVEDYKFKTNSLEGVGATKVYPVWDGGGTVKLEIISSDFAVPGTALVNEVQNQIDPQINPGEGLGIAPIGHTVTVVGVSEDTIDIGMTITYTSGWDWAALETAAQQVIDGYFLELKQSWQDSANLIVRISQIETRMLDLDGVIDITGTTINGAESNYIVVGIPKRGSLSG